MGEEGENGGEAEQGRAEGLHGLIFRKGRSGRNIHRMARSEWG